jgi:hypothetical protein
MKRKHRRSYRNKRERTVYLWLILAAIVLAFGIRLAMKFSIDVNFIFLSLVVLLLIGAIILAAKRM